jgi:hypothetical protein
MQCAQACLRQLALYCFDLQTKSWQGYKNTSSLSKIKPKSGKKSYLKNKNKLNRSWR